MAAITICSDYGAPKNKIWHCFHCFPIYFPWSDGQIPWSSFSECWALGQLFTWGGQSTGVSALASLLPKTLSTDLQNGLVGSPCSPRDSQESSPTPQFKSINSLALSLLHSPTLTSIHDHWKIIALTRRTFVGKVITLLFNILSRLVITFLPKSKHLLISWLQSPSAVILEPQKIKCDTVSTVSSSISYEVMGPDAMIFIFWLLSFKPAFSLSLSLSSRVSLVPLHFLPYGWCHHYIWGYWYFSW